MLRKLLLGLVAVVFSASLANAAKLYISEYNSLTITSGLTAQAAPEPSFDQVPVDYTAGATSSAAFGSSTSYVRVICDTQCSVKFGTSPIATNANKVLPALSPEYFGVPQGQAYKISVIANP